MRIHFRLLVMVDFQERLKVSGTKRISIVIFDGGNETGTFNPFVCHAGIRGDRNFALK